MNKKKIIEYNLNFYILEKDIFETDEMFQYRIDYIISNLKKDSFDNLIKMSRLTTNTHFWGSEYNSSVKEKIQKSF